MECTTPRVNLKVNHCLWVIMVCHCRVIIGSKCITLVRDIDNQGDCVCVGPGSIWELCSLHSISL